ALELRGNVTHWPTYTGPNERWSLSYPTGWHATPIGQKCSFGGYRGGVVVSNVGWHFFQPPGGAEGCFAQLVPDRFPSTGVALALAPAPGNLLNDLAGPRGPDTAFPLSVSQLIRTPSVPRVQGGPRDFYLPIVRHRGQV